MPQIYMIVTPHAKDVLMPGIDLLASNLILAVEKGFGIDGLKDTAFTVPAPVLYIDGEKEVQIEIRYTAGEDEYDRGQPFDPSLEDQGKLAGFIEKVFREFCDQHHLERLSLSVWCKPYYRSAFREFD